MEKAFTWSVEGAARRATVTISWTACHSAFTVSPTLDFSFLVLLVWTSTVPTGFHPMRKGAHRSLSKMKSLAAAVWSSSLPSSHFSNPRAFLRSATACHNRNPDAEQARLYQHLALMVLFQQQNSALLEQQHRSHQTLVQHLQQCQEQLVGQHLVQRQALAQAFHANLLPWWSCETNGVFQHHPSRHAHLGFDAPWWLSSQGTSEANGGA